MIAHDIHQAPVNLVYNYGEIAELPTYEIAVASEAGFCEMWYWYSEGDCEGSGQAILRKEVTGDDGKPFSQWALHNLGHCSCMGPFSDNLPSSFNLFDDPEEMFSNCTSDLKDEIRPLMREVRKLVNKKPTHPKKPGKSKSIIHDILDALLEGDEE